MMHAILTATVTTLHSSSQKRTPFPQSPLPPSKVVLKPLIRPHILPMPVEQPRDRPQRKRDERDERIAPPEAELVVHLEAEEGEALDGLG